MDEMQAISAARKLLKEQAVTQAPINVDALALTLGFKVSRKDLPEGEAGITFERRGQKHIFVNQNDGLHRQRFTILHEIAHHVLELPSVHGSSVPSDELECFKSRPPEEVLCDTFAAECLVPWLLIQPFATQSDFTHENLTVLSDFFQASRSCVASRFAQVSNDHLAFIVAEEGIVQYAITSRGLREAKIWITKMIHIPRNSAAAKAMELASGQVMTADLDGLDWSASENASRFVCYEEATYYALKKQTQSIVLFEEIVKTSSGTKRESRSEDDDLLEELSGYPGWSKYR
ncbi:ImmA/IrrE family metallo-endopeptidase [Rahnella contaminans]|uniref:ImmA/IrrE family metallo-endopeptidase n=1 Tax=Rahnella contaminans TaxID=2703882 RepID=UPI0023DB87EC|nr:ImmA/IrrE family metallo-endopeptidase [Rahnella contaminans]MDF1896684.1 ImmA/IrrE family metallo-endopeptidase [Rahnella contaminans]